MNKNRKIYKWELLGKNMADKNFRAQILIGRETRNPDGTPITYDWGTHVVKTGRTHLAMIIDSCVQNVHRITLSNLYRDCKRIGYEYGAIIAQKGIDLEDCSIENGYAADIVTNRRYRVNKVSQGH